MVELQVPIKSTFANATKGATLTNTANIPDGTSEDLEILIPDGKELLLSQLLVDLDGGTLNSLKIDNVDLKVNSEMIGTDKHIDFEKYYGLPIYVDDKITLNIAASGVAIDPLIATRGLLLSATH